MKKFYYILIAFLIPLILSSSDWKFNADFGGGKIVSIGCADSNNCYAVQNPTKGGKLYKSKDQGKNWKLSYTFEPFDEEYPFLLNCQGGVSPHKDHYYLYFLETCIIKKSTDGGETFERIKLSDDRSVHKMAMLDTNTGIAIASDYVYVTFDGWETFEQRDTAYGGSYRSPIFINDSSIQCIATDGRLLNYNLYLNKWSVFYDFENNPQEKYHDTFLILKYADNKTGYLVGYRPNGVGDQSVDIIYKTSDGGKSWNKILDNEYEPIFGLQDIAFYDENNGVAVGARGKFLITNDGGNTWKYDVPNEIFKTTDSAYGPPTVIVAWAGKNPIVGSYGGNIYRYDGDYFNFDNNTSGFSISGKIMEDGSGLANISVTNGESTTITDNSGEFIFNNLKEGNYTITPENPNYEFTPQKQELELTEDVSDINFTAKRIETFFDLSGKVTYKGDGVKNVMIQIEKYRAFTDEDGEYIFEDLPKRNGEKSYTIKPTYLYGDVNFEPNEIELNLVSDTTGFDFVIKDQLFKISGTVTEIDVGKAIALTNGIDTVYSNTNTGKYEFNNIPAGSMEIWPFRRQDTAMYYITPNKYEIEVNNDIDELDFELERKYYDLTIKVTNADDEPLEGIKFKIRDSIGNFKTVITNKEGIYTFENEPSRYINLYAPDGTFEVKYEPYRSTFYLLSDSIVKFEAVYPENYYSVSGKVTKNGEGLKHARLILYSNDFGNEKVMTNSEGIYKFNKVPEGNFSIYEPETFGHNSAFEPRNYTLEVNEDITGINFEQKEELYRISGYVLTPEGKGIPDISINSFQSNIPTNFNVLTDSTGWYITDFIYPFQDELQIFAKNKNDSNNIYKFSPKHHIIKLNSDTSEVNFIMTNITNVYAINEIDMVIYPNPIESILTINISTKIKKIVVFNIQQKRVKSFDGSNFTTIDLSDLQSGVYSIRITDINGNIYYKKVVKE